ncbi:UNVERIFIED_CONTAM: hypothetical protein Sindi_2284400 [Sesamum indicum]
MSRAYFLVLLLGALLATSTIANDKFDDEQELHKRKPHHPPRHAPAPTPKPSLPHPHVSDNDVEFDEEINEIELKQKRQHPHKHAPAPAQKANAPHSKVSDDVEEFNQIKRKHKPSHPPSSAPAPSPKHKNQPPSRSNSIGFF